MEAAGYHGGNMFARLFHCPAGIGKHGGVAFLGEAVNPKGFVCAGENGRENGDCPRTIV